MAAAILFAVDAGLVLAIACTAAALEWGGWWGGG